MFVQACLDEAALARSKRFRHRGSKFALRLCQRRALQEVVSLAAMLVIVGDCLVQALPPQVKTAIFIEPAFEPIPLADERFVSDFHGFLLTGRGALAPCV